MKNIIALLSLVLLGALLAFYGCADGPAGKPSQADVGPPGATIFKKNCVACHGSNGQMGLNGAANLATSVLTKEEAIDVITNGRKMMAPYKSLLSAQEITEVADYVMTLRQ